eukprot:Pompholyxophrys_punicea_v1_NODE_25_length_5265_cov_107.938388.p9 type:complete len:110 gc:universal NODE_25_length_5265_cov_107.938388:5142-4813(-)
MDTMAIESLSSMISDHLTSLFGTYFPSLIGIPVKLNLKVELDNLEDNTSMLLALNHQTGTTPLVRKKELVSTPSLLWKIPSSSEEEYHTYMLEPMVVVDRYSGLDLSGF